jgi:hypothetical protein
MVNKLLIVALLVIAGCTTPKVINEPALGYSFMPKYLDLDSIKPDLPQLPDTLAYKNALTYRPKFISGGIGLQGKDTISLPPGVLVSEKSSVRYIFYEAAYDRMKTELAYSKSLCKDYYDKSLSAEKVYQEEIKRLRESNRRTWLEQNIGYIGFIAGIGTAVLTEWAVLHVK